MAKLEKFSPSMMIDYLSCPLLFYYRYVAKIRLPQKQIHLLFGSAIHRAVEAIFEKEEPYSLFIETFDKNKLLNEEKGLHKEYLDLGHEMIKNYLNEYPTLNSLYELDKGKSEVYIKRILKNPLTGEEMPIPMSGRIDRLTDSDRIVEYKTSAKKWSANEIRSRVQTLLYNLWFYSEYGKVPEETLYIILLKKYKKVGRGETFQVLSKNCTLTELAGTFDEIKILLEKINNNEFDRPKGFHPKWCDCHRYEEELNLNK